MTGTNARKPWRPLRSRPKATPRRRSINGLIADQRPTLRIADCASRHRCSHATPAATENRGNRNGNTARARFQSNRPFEPTVIAACAANRRIAHWCATRPARGRASTCSVHRSPQAPGPIALPDKGGESNKSSLIERLAIRNPPAPVGSSVNRRACSPQSNLPEQLGVRPAGRDAAPGA